MVVDCCVPHWQLWASLNESFLCRWRKETGWVGRTSSASSSDAGLLPFFGRFLAGFSPASLAFLALLAAPAAGFSSALTDVSAAPCWLAALVSDFPPSLILKDGFPAPPATASASAFTMPPCSSQLQHGYHSVGLFAIHFAVKSCWELVSCCACGYMQSCMMQALGACSSHRCMGSALGTSQTCTKRCSRPRCAASRTCYYQHVLVTDSCIIQRT